MKRTLCFLLAISLGYASANNAKLFDNFLDPILSKFNYYVDGDFFLFEVKPIIFPKKSLKSSHGASSIQTAITCPVCKASSWVLRNTIGSNLYGWEFEQVIKAICYVVLPLTSDISGSNCEGIVNQ